jgi:preprotein translocase subunit SecG
MLFGLFTVILFVDCVLLIAFVLVQLPKKEAGAGMAFGGAATDALFGAGSGSAVTVITKYLAGVFFGLSLIMAIMTSHSGQSGGSELENAITKPGAAPAGRITEPAAGPAVTNFPAFPPPAGAAPSSAAPAAPAPNPGVLPAIQLPPPSPATN